MTDAQHYLIPDGFTLFGLDVRAAHVGDRVLPRRNPASSPTPYDALIGACAGAGMIAIVGWLGEVVTKREAMGLGDVTLMAFVGAALGPTRALITVFRRRDARRRRVRRRRDSGRAAAARTCARADGARARPPPFETPLVPFGVFLAPAALLTLFWGDALLAWLRAASGMQRGQRPLTLATRTSARRRRFRLTSPVRPQ